MHQPDSRGRRHVECRPRAVKARRLWAPLAPPHVATTGAVAARRCRWAYPKRTAPLLSDGGCKTRPGVDAEGSWALADRVPAVRSLLAHPSTKGRLLCRCFRSRARSGVSVARAPWPACWPPCSPRALRSSARTPPTPDRRRPPKQYYLHLTHLKCDAHRGLVV